MLESKNIENSELYIWQKSTIFDSILSNNLTKNLIKESTIFPDTHRL